MRPLSLAKPSALLLVLLLAGCAAPAAQQRSGSPSLGGTVRGQRLSNPLSALRAGGTLVGRFSDVDIAGGEGVFDVEEAVSGVRVTHRVPVALTARTAYFAADGSVRPLEDMPVAGPTAGPGLKMVVRRKDTAVVAVSVRVDNGSIDQTASATGGEELRLPYWIVIGPDGRGVVGGILMGGETVGPPRDVTSIILWHLWTPDEVHGIDVWHGVSVRMNARSRLWIDGKESTATLVGRDAWDPSESPSTRDSLFLIHVEQQGTGLWGESVECWESTSSVLRPDSGRRPRS